LQLSIAGATIYTKAMAEEMAIVTVDENVAKYGIKTIW